MVRRHTKEDWELKKGGTIENEMEATTGKSKEKDAALSFIQPGAERPAAASAGELLNISASICIYGRVL